MIYPDIVMAFVWVETAECHLGSPDPKTSVWESEFEGEVLDGMSNTC